MKKENETKEKEVRSLTLKANNKVFLMKKE
jgi:hypothetical protein